MQASDSYKTYKNFIFSFKKHILHPFWTFLPFLSTLILILHCFLSSSLVSNLPAKNTTLLVNNGSDETIPGGFKAHDCIIFFISAVANHAQV